MDKYGKIWNYVDAPDEYKQLDGNADKETRNHRDDWIIFMPTEDGCRGVNVVDCMNFVGQINIITKFAGGGTVFIGYRDILKE